MQEAGMNLAQWDEAVEQQKKLDKSVGIKNPYLGMSFKELKALGRGLR